MNRIASATCPRCGAGLHPVPGQEQVICQYCGTTSFVQQAQPAAGVPVRRAKGGAVFVVIGVVVLVLVGASAAAFTLLSSEAPRPQHAPPVLEAVVTTDVHEVSPAVPEKTPKPSPAAKIEVQGEFRPLLADVNGDGILDVVTAIEAANASHYAVFSGVDGRELARTSAVADAERSVTAIVGRRLIAVSQKGQLTGYGLANGGQQWTTALDARSAFFCAGKSDDELIVVTDDDRRLAIDLTTGRQSETKAPCKVRLTAPDRGDDPRDRHDYAAPIGTESYHCGGVRVMGSQNYTVADQCLARAKVDTDRLDGFIGHRLWKVEQGWLAFGIRKPGAYVPMLGLVARGKLSWKQLVPRDNPLEAETGSSHHVGLVGDMVVAAYGLEKERTQFVTAFKIADGTRSWHVALPSDVQRLSSLATSAQRVVIVANEQLLLLDARDGKLIARVGGGS